jgi:hypothetical protein
MTKIIGTTLDFTTEQLDYFEKEMRAYKLPWIPKMHYKYGVPFARFGMLPIILYVLITGIIYNSSAYGVNEWMWTVDLIIAFFLIFGFGGFTAIAWLIKKLSVNSLRTRLGLSHNDFDILVIAFQITGM